MFELSELELGIGVAGLSLIVAFWTWIGKMRSRSMMQKEIESLKSNLQTYMSIHAKGYEEIQKEVDRLKKENENLRITVATLSNKPGRAEIKMLHTWDKALKIMSLRSPGFAPAWETAIDEAKREVEEADSGMRAIVRKVFALLPPENNTASARSQND
jgi:uncharacterized coiled-coil DUF342 family protein